VPRQVLSNVKTSRHWTGADTAKRGRRNLRDGPLQSITESSLGQYNLARGVMGTKFDLKTLLRIWNKYRQLWQETSCVTVWRCANRAAPSDYFATLCPIQMIGRAAKVSGDGLFIPDMSLRGVFCYSVHGNYPLANCLLESRCSAFAAVIAEI